MAKAQPTFDVAESSMFDGPAFAAHSQQHLLAGVAAVVPFKRCLLFWGGDLAPAICCLLSIPVMVPMPLQLSSPFSMRTTFSPALDKSSAKVQPRIHSAFGIQSLANTRSCWALLVFHIWK